MFSLIAAAGAALALQTALDLRVRGVPGTGLAVGVIDHGAQRIYVAGSTGKGRPVDQHTLFEIGSVSKTLTTTALAAMVLDSQVRLDEPIGEFLPKDVRAPSKNGIPITLLTLAEQRSGLPRLPTNMNDVSADDPYANYSLADMYAFLDGYTLTRDPGSAYEYSNYGVSLLGQLLANQMQTSYPILIRRSVLQPLGMTDTSFATTGEPDPAALAVGHDLGGNPVATWHATSILPAGGVLSDLDDMLKYLRCNMGQGPLSRACLFTQAPRASGEPGHDIGLVWNINTRTGIIAHGGDTHGFHAYVAVSKDRQTGVVALSNGPLVIDIAAHVLDSSYPIGACPASVPVANTKAASYAGVYCNVSGALTFTVEKTATPDALSIALLPQGSLTYQRTATDTFAAPSVGVTFRFARDRAGIVGLWLMQNGATIPATRLNSRGEAVIAQLPAAFPKTISLNGAILSQYVGTYASGVGTFTVTLRGDTLYVQLTAQPAVPVYASAKDQFFYKIVDAQISFERDASGAVMALTLTQNGLTVRANRSKP